MRNPILFLHVLGVLGLFIGLALEWLRVDAPLNRVFGLAAAVTIASGVYLATRIGVFGNAWLRTANAALLLLIVIGIAFRRLRSDRLQRFGLHLRTALALSILYLMIAKPPAAVSATVVGVGVVGAIALSATSFRRAVPERV
jgi:hypothetical protein